MFSAKDRNRAESIIRRSIRNLSLHNKIMLIKTLWGMNDFIKVMNIAFLPANNEQQTKILEAIEVTQLDIDDNDDDFWQIELIEDIQDIRIEYVALLSNILATSPRYHMMLAKNHPQGFLIALYDRVWLRTLKKSQVDPKAIRYAISKSDLYAKKVALRALSRIT